MAASTNSTAAPTDGSSFTTAWPQPPGTYKISPARCSQTTASRGFPRQARGGSTEYVAVGGGRRYHVFRPNPRAFTACSW